MNTETLKTEIVNYFGVKRNYRFYSLYKNGIDKLVCAGRGAANLCRFVDKKCYINNNIAKPNDIEYIKQFCIDNGFEIEYKDIKFHENNL